MTNQAYAIGLAVGKNAVNRRNDVELVQRLLNRALDNFPKFKSTEIKKLAVDGICGALTLSAIEKFQQTVLGWNGSAVDGRIEPNKQTWEKLNQHIDSVKYIYTPDTARGLTEEEIKLLKPIFKTSIDYRNVKIHNKPYTPFQGDNAVTPNGEIYFQPKDFRRDFSHCEDYSDTNRFIHEIVHVWQYQLGCHVKSKGLSAVMRGSYTGSTLTETYNYDISGNDKKTIADFNFENQADLIADYYKVKYFGKIHPNVIRNVLGKNSKYTESWMKKKDDKNFISKLRKELINKFEIVLNSFLKNPKSKDLLPKKSTPTNETLIDLISPSEYLY